MTDLETSKKDKHEKFGAVRMALFFRAARRGMRSPSLPQMRKKQKHRNNSTCADANILNSQAAKLNLTSLLLNQL